MGLSKCLGRAGEGESWSHLPLPPSLLMVKMMNKFIKGLIDSGEFWLFSAGSYEWYYVMSEIGARFFPNCRDETKDFGIALTEDGKDPLYWARRSMLPASEVEKRLGVPAEVLEKAKVIRLAPFPKEPKEPTVDYFGLA